jgi:hypothetical protein
MRPQKHRNVLKTLDLFSQTPLYKPDHLRHAAWEAV